MDLSLLLWAAIMAASLAVLVRAAGSFIGAAEVIGLHLGLTPFVVGVSVLAVGTSLPELMAGVLAVLQGAPEIAVGTAVGSNVTNILLILGFSAVASRGLRVKHELVRVDLPFLFGAAFAMWLLAYDGKVDALEGTLALLALAVYLAYVATGTGEGGGTSVGTAAPSVVPEAAPPALRTWVLLVVSGVAVQVGAHFTVRSVVEISSRLEVSSAIIATTVLALGTSLPELVVSVRAARAGRPELAVGNVIGSNIFNALGVVGVPALIGVLTVPASLTSFAMPAMIGVTVLAFFVLQEREITRWDGYLLLVLYAAFVAQMARLG